MTSSAAGPESVVTRLEPWLVWALGAIAMAAVPVLLGGIGISWDGLNHHFYLGWVATQPRFDRDLIAASYQAYQFPYLYWPVYQLAAANAGGVAAGVVLALLQSLAIPPAWIVARACCPGPTWADRALRLVAVVLAFSGGMTLSLLDSTSNDMLAAIPLLWAVALAFLAADAPAERSPGPLAWMMLSGLCGGVAVACKLSNGLLVLVLPLAWAMAPGTIGQRAMRVLAAGIALVAGLVVTYGYWGWQLWVHTGNPVYPFYDGWFEHVRAWTGWRP